MPTDARTRNTKPGAKPAKLTDGAGLYLEVPPSGGQHWRRCFGRHGRPFGRFRLIFALDHPNGRQAMPRKKKTVRVIHLSLAPLPPRHAVQHVDRLLVFSDASRKRQGGLAAVLFATPESEALVGTKSVPLVGSNELELQAAIFALAQVRQHFPGRPFSLFSDNQDAVLRLLRARQEGCAQDPELSRLLDQQDTAETLKDGTICWIKGHSTCRGNMLADMHAAAAAS